MYSGTSLLRTSMVPSHVIVRNICPALYYTDTSPLSGEKFWIVSDGKDFLQTTILDVLKEEGI